MDKKFEYDYTKLKIRIKKKYGSMTKFAEAMNCTKGAMSMKLNNQSQWKQEDISQAVILLNIPERQIYSFFYATKVKN